MVSLSLLKLLENNGFGVIDQNLFWEKMGLDEDGIYITDAGGDQIRGSRPYMTYQIYSRADSDVKAYKQLQDIAEFLKRSFAVCELPSVPPVTNYGYGNVTIMPPSTIVSAGQDINGRTIYSITGQVYFGEKIQYDKDGYKVTAEDNRELNTENDKLILTEKK